MPAFRRAPCQPLLTASRHRLRGFFRATSALAVLGLFAALPTAQAGTVAAGVSHTCAAVGAQVQCWGNNKSSQLGRNTSTTIQGVVTGPVEHLPSPPLAVVAGTEHSCELAIGGAIYCWGSNKYGELGDPDAVDGSTPISVNTKNLPSGDTFTQLAANGRHNCAVANGAVYCWGQGIGPDSGNNYNAPAQIAPQDLFDITEVAVGAQHACARKLTPGGNPVIQCWGNDGSGQLGDGGGNVDSPVPVPAFGFESMQIAAGGDTTCYIHSANGNVYCWGAGSYGQLGNDTVTNANAVSSPVKLPNGNDLPDVIGIAVGGRHACAFVIDQVFCWGDNSLGQLGDGTNINRSHAVSVQGIVLPNNDTVASLSAGDSHTCAQLASGKVYCWGSVLSGQLGIGGIGIASFSSPQLVNGLQLASMAAGSGHTCATQIDDSLRCWGDNNRGQLGDNGGALAGQIVAVDLFNEPVTAVAAGGLHTCAVSTQTGNPNFSKLRCWGANTYGQLGNNATTDLLEPPANAILSNSWAAGQPLNVLRSAAAGAGHACAVVWDAADSTHKAWCWGGNANGQLGSTPVGTDKLQPTLVGAPNTSMQQITTGTAHSCVRYEGPAGGIVRCWGQQLNGRLGNGATAAANITTLSQVFLAGGSGFDALSAKSVAAGGSHTCAIAGDDTVYCWGSDSLGQLGNGAVIAGDQSRAFQIPNFSGIGAIAVGFDHSCVAVTGDGGKIYCWGANNYGQLGLGNTANQSSPQQVPSLGIQNVLGLAAGDYHTCAYGADVNGDRIAKCWGKNLQGQLGIGATAYKATAQPLALFDISDVAVAEGDNPAQPNTMTFTVTRTNTAYAADVDVDIVPITAQLNNDYSIANPHQTLHFDPNDPDESVVVAIVGDTVYEPHKTFEVRLSNPTGAAIGRGVATGTINNDDAQPQIAFAANVVTGFEDVNSPGLQFTVQLSNSSIEPVSVNFEVVEDTAKAGIDYGLPSPSSSGTLTFAALETSKTITVPIIDDQLDEPDAEGFFVELNNPVNASLAGDNQATGGILDNDLPPTVTIGIGNPNRLENTADSNNFIFEVHLSAASGHGVTVDYGFANNAGNGWATPGDDFLCITCFANTFTGTLNFPPGVTEGFIEVDPVNDSDSELEESFVVQLSNPVNVSLGNPQEESGTIVDDESSPLSFQLSGISQAEGTGGNSTLVFTVTRTNTTTMAPGGGQPQLTVSTQNSNPASATGGAAETPGVDYVSIAPTVYTFAPNSITLDIPVTVIGDSAFEPNETFLVYIANPTVGNIIFAGDIASGTIQNDDAPTLAIGAFGPVDEAAGTFTFTITVPAGNNTVDVDYTLGGSATGAAVCGAGIDYCRNGWPNGHITFPPSPDGNNADRVQSVSVTLVNDNLDEDDETIILTLSNASGVLLPSPASASVTVSDDDAPPQLTIAAPASVAEGTDGTLTFTLTVPAGGKDVAVNYALGGSATGATTDSAGIDYFRTEGLTGTLTFPKNDLSARQQTIIVTITNDSVAENAKNIVLTLSNPLNIVLPDPPARSVTLMDADQALPPGTTIFKNGFE